MSTTSELPNLSTAQRNLLLAALASNKRSKTSSFASQEKASDYFPQFAAPQKLQQSSYDSVDPAIFDLNNSNIGYDSTFDDSILSFDDNSNIDLGLVLQGPNAFDNEAHDKRKSPNDEEEDDEDDYDNKRQEGDDKAAKKPGRKLITAEPTTVSLPCDCYIPYTSQLNYDRSEKRRIVPLSVRFENARRNT